MKKLLIVCIGLAVGTAQGGGLDWRADRFLPSFAAPATVIDCIDVTSASAAQLDLFASLEGIVNRYQPRLACINGSAEEGKTTWLTLHNLSYSLISGYGAVLKYRTNVTGLVVTDPSQPDTLNLATTIAGLKNELVCDPGLLAALTNAPYNLPVLEDLRDRFADKYQIYQQLYTNYWPQCTRRIFAGMAPSGHGHLREYLVAVKAATVWLDPGVPTDAAALAPFIADMTPAGGVYMGWWPDEGSGLTWIAQYGIPVLASDWFDNASLFGGVTTTITVPPIPPAPPLQNKVYVSLTLSDGDNVQYMQHYMKKNWGNPARGSVPIGWTAQPLAADMDPGMLNFYWSSATTNDCLVAGPSGAGYSRIDFWNAPDIIAHAQTTELYLQRSGMRSITVWLSVSADTANAFAANCPTLLGVTAQNGGYYATHYGALSVIAFPPNGGYTSTAATLISSITNAAATWNGSAPMFIPVQGSGWDITPADCQTIANALDPAKYAVVRPDHLFLLYQQAAGLTNSGAPVLAKDLPPSMKLPAGFPLVLLVNPVGAKPMSYQWRLNGVDLTNSIRIRGAQSASLTVNPTFAGDVGQYSVVASNSSGSVTSTVCSVTVGRNDLSATAGWTRNGAAGPMTNNSVRLTNGNGSEAASVFLNAPQHIGKFQAAFTYQDVGGGGADGFAFVLHNAAAGPSALGAPGGSIGYSGISPSVALTFNIYSPYGVGMAVRTNGQTGPPFASTSPVNIASGNPIAVSLGYDGATLSVALSNHVTHVTFRTNTAVNLAGILGADKAYVGVTGADGGISSIQAISSFQFASLTTLAVQPMENAVNLTWPNAAAGLVLQSAPAPGLPWTTTTNPVELANNRYNQVIVPPTNSTKYYRLATP